MARRDGWKVEIKKPRMCFTRFSLQVREGREAGVPLGGHRAFRERSEALRGGGAQRRLFGEGAPSGPAQVVGLPPRVHVAKPRPLALPLLRQGAAPRRGHGGRSSGPRGRRAEISRRAPDFGKHRRGERERCAEPRPELPRMQREEGKQDGALADSRRFGGSSVVLDRPPHRAGAVCLWLVFGGGFARAAYILRFC